MVARQAVVDVVNAKNLNWRVQNYVIVMEIAIMLHIWLGGKEIFIYSLMVFVSIFSH